MHVREIVIDYFASLNHWLFNFERYNQDVKNIRTNRKDCIEKTYLHKFLLQVHIEDYAQTVTSSLPTEMKQEVQFFS